MKGKDNIKKILLYAFLFAALILAVGVYAFSGKAFLGFVGKELHIGLSYSNWVDFVSCFVIRRVRLDRPLFIIKDFRNTPIKADFAYIVPSFDRLLNEKGIELTFTLENARLAEPVAGTQDLERAEFLPADLWPVLTRGAFDTITTTVFMHGDTAEFLSFEAASESIKINAAGRVSESGAVHILAHILFSPALVESLPENISQNLKVSPSGWGKYDLRFDMDSGEKGFKLESDRIRIEFKRVDLQ